MSSRWHTGKILFDEDVRFDVASAAVRCAFTAIPGPPKRIIDAFTQP